MRLSEESGSDFYGEQNEGSDIEIIGACREEVC